MEFTTPPRVLEGYNDQIGSHEINATSGWVHTRRWCCFLKVLQANHHNEFNKGSRTHNSRHNHCWSEWLCELLMDLPIVEKPIPAILMNCDNQTVIVKVNSSKNNMKSSRHVKRPLKSIKKLRNFGVIALDYIQTPKNLIDQFTKGLLWNVIDNVSLEL